MERYRERQSNGDRKKETKKQRSRQRQARVGRWHRHLTKEFRGLTRISLTAARPKGDDKYEEKKSRGTATAFIGAKELVKQTVCPFRCFCRP